MLGMKASALVMSRAATLLNSDSSLRCEQHRPRAAVYHRDQRCSAAHAMQAFACRIGLARVGRLGLAAGYGKS